MTVTYLRPGIGSWEVQASRCLVFVLLSIIVVRMRQVGLVGGILQWLTALSHAQYVSIGPLDAVSGLNASGSVIAAVSTCTSCPQLVTVIYGTVVTES